MRISDRKVLQCPVIRNISFPKIYEIFAALSQREKLLYDIVLILIILEVPEDRSKKPQLNIIPIITQKCFFLLCLDSNEIDSVDCIEL